MPRSRTRALLGGLVLLAAAAGAACGAALGPKYEYEEEIYLALDGSATVYVNASVPALVALRGAPLDADPRARLDRDAVRAFFESPVARVASVTDSRRSNRRYVHVRLDVPDVRRLGAAAPFAWSRYQFAERDGQIEYRQVLGAAAGRDVGDVGWTGDEQVAVRLHLPSRVTFHNQPGGEIARGNIIAWEQPLAARRAGEPLVVEARMDTESILARTLTLFGVMIVLALSTLALLIWLVMRRGRDEPAAGGPASPGSPPARSV
ncbi:MAG: hypothetical protein AB7H88_11085 [Vicinamibacterales bacterium]